MSIFPYVDTWQVQYTLDYRDAISAACALLTAATIGYIIGRASLWRRLEAEGCIPLVDSEKAKDAWRDRVNAHWEQLDKRYQFFSGSSHGGSDDHSEAP